MNTRDGPMLLDMQNGRVWHGFDTADHPYLWAYIDRANDREQVAKAFAASEEARKKATQ